MSTFENQQCDLLLKIDICYNKCHQLDQTDTPCRAETSGKGLRKVICDKT